jgi:hypothetical protein
MPAFFRSDGWVKSAIGPAVPGAQVFVCTQPANTTKPVPPRNSPPITNWTPTPLATIYSDAAGLEPITQPIVTDGFGHYDFYALPGVYTIVVMLNGNVQQVYGDQSLAVAGSSGLLIETNGIANVDQTLLNLVQGTNITISTDVFGATTISGAAGATFKTDGVPNTLQSVLNLKSGTNISLAADALGGVTISSSSPSVTLETNGVLNTLQSVLNLKNGTNISLSADGSGGVTISSSPSLTLETNGVVNGSQTLLNLKGSANITITDDGAGGVTVSATGLGTGTVTHTGSLTANQLILGNGAADITPLGSLGTTTTVLHGNAGGVPSFSAVVEADITLSNNTTNNVSTTKHGFAPILPNDATKFLDGTGAYSTPTGSGTVTHTGTLTLHALMLGNGSADITALASLGTTTTVLHGNAAGDPSFSAVVEADITLANNTTNNVSITKHGFCPILPNDAAKFLDGTGAFSTPGGGSASSIQGVAVSASTPRIGDTLRYNEYADSKWDVVAGVPRFMTAFAEYNAGGVSAIGYAGATNVQNFSGGSSGGSTAVAATGTEPPLQNFATNSSASTSANSQVLMGLGSLNAAKFTAGTVRRFSCRAKLKSTSNSRYWIGLCFGGGQVPNNTSLATDTPNGKYIMFRYSATTDATIKAVTATDNTHQTVANTTVSVDTANTVLFEIAYDGSNAYFYINGTLTNTVSTNLLAASDLVIGCISLDNKNTANSVEFDFAWMTMTLK